LRWRAGRQRGDLLPRARDRAVAPRLCDHGQSGAEARQIIEAEIGRKLPDDLEAQVKQETLRFYEGDLKAIAHVGDAIAAIEPPKCVASSGTPEKIRHGLSCARLYEQLAPHIFSATQVERGKPAPDLFLFAAEQMKATPARCIVIEDSVPGVTGARAAGMAVLGFFGGSHCTGEHEAMLRAAGAERTFSDMRELPGLIERFSQKRGSVAGFSAL
jgi:HAD superfamily hydrolase (TIGR01509 family)